MRNQLIQTLIGIAVVAVVGVTMAATGFTADSFMGLVLVAVGVFLLWSSAKYWQKPFYTDASGQTKAVSKPMIVFMIVMAVLLFGAGCYVGIFGIPK